MICPKCKELGQKSFLTVGHGMGTCGNYQPYYDEEGNYHNHDGNVNSQSYYCSNGHYITVTSTGKCLSCNWGHDSEKVIVRDVDLQTITISSNTGTVKIKND